MTVDVEKMCSKSKLYYQLKSQIDCVEDQIETEKCYNFLKSDT